MATKTIKCGNCQVAAQTTSDPQADDMVICPICGRSDTYNNVMESVADQIQYQTEKMFHDGIKGIARGSKVLSYKGANPIKPTAQFVIDMNF